MLPVHAVDLAVRVYVPAVAPEETLTATVEFGLPGTNVTPVAAGDIVQVVGLAAAEVLMLNILLLLP